MICLEISVNGKKLAVAGLGSDGVISAIVNWVATPASKHSKRRTEKMFLSLGGLANGKHVTWIKAARKTLKKNDTVKVKIIECRNHSPLKQYPKRTAKASVQATAHA